MTFCTVQRAVTTPCGDDDVREADDIIKKIHGGFNVAVSLMDDTLREALHEEIAPCSDEEFLARYIAAHLAYYHEDFAFNVFHS